MDTRRAVDGHGEGIRIVMEVSRPCSGIVIGRYWKGVRRVLE